ncbi:MAG: LLM class flavin-dependent oxidoreductase [Candidatus Bathyarchaeota archaeon]|nr:MAG: LLM class flavin-dependent oxidoreductase [Candidatus Bathyarchaeota archaeon]
MKFFLTGLGNLHENTESIMNGIITADQYGFHGALMPDHFMWGNQIGHRMQNPYVTLETWTFLTYIAAQTENIHLGTLVTPLPFRHPGVLAKRLATLDNLSRGRVILGVGAGWSTVEFDGYSEWVGSKSRVDKTIEALDIMTRLWTEDSVSHESQYYTMKNAVLEPKPVQKPYPKLLFGSSGNRMLRLTGKMGDYCFIPPWLMQNAAQVREIVLKAAKEAGRTDKLEFIGGIMAAIAPYNTKEYTKIVEMAEKSRATVCNIAFPRDTIVEDIKKFTKEILSSYV